MFPEEIEGSAMSVGNRMFPRVDSTESVRKIFYC